MRRLPFVLLTALLFTRTAAAEEVADAGPWLRTPREEPTKKVWYGWQTLVADGATIGLGSLVGVRTDSAVPFLVGYALAGPLVHLANERPAAAALSFVFRVGTPLTLGGLTYLATHEENCDGRSMCNLGSGLATFSMAVLGMLGAIAVDSAVLARKEAPREPTLSLSPTFTAGNGRTMVGLGGTF